MNGRLFGVVIAVLVILGGIVFIFQDHSTKTVKSGPQNQCADKVIQEYWSLSNVLTTKESAIETAGGSSVEVQIAHRRLEEEFCRKMATCGIITSNPQRNPLVFSTEFSDCLIEEMKTDISSDP